MLGSREVKKCTQKLNLLGHNLPQQKYFIAKFHDFFDGLLGTEFLAICKGAINYDNETLTLNDKIFQFKKYFLGKKKTSSHSIEIKTTKDGDWVLAKPYTLPDNTTILPGLYSSKEGKSTVKALSNSSHPQIPTQIFQVRVNNFETVEPPLPTTNELDADKIAQLIRTDHMSPLERERVIQTIRLKQKILLKQGEKLSATNTLKHRIITTDDNPIYTKSYRYPQNFKKDVHQQIKDMLADGIIQNSKSPYSAPIWVVPKKLDASGERKVRLVVDYRKLNDKTKDDKFPLPKIEEILDNLGQCTYFTTLDLKSGFHQILMDPRDREKTAFSSDLGHYEFIRMPFGLKNAPATFQRMMIIVLDGLLGHKCFVYLDDIIVIGRDLDEHLRNLEEVLDRLTKFNLKIQLDKCEFLKRETEFLGHVITPDGVKPNPEKIKEIINWEIPKTAKQIKQFLGFTSYYRRFIKNYADIVKPLTKCLKKDTPLNHDAPDFIKACVTLKNIIASDQVLAYPDFNKPFIVTTDASDYAIGAVISQIQNAVERPIAFASRTLSDTELRWSTTEKEALAIIWATRKFKPYLYGTKFTLITDHMPLTFIKTSTKNSKILRWRLELEEFDYDIQFRTGKSNVVADGLSRKPENVTLFSTVSDQTNHSADDSDDYFIHFVERPINYYRNQIIFRISNIESIARETPFQGYQRIFILDNNYTEEKIVNYLRNYHNGKQTAIQAPLELVNLIQEAHKNHFSAQGHFVLTQNMVEDVALEERQDAIIAKEHERAHRGINENLNQIKRGYFFPKMHDKIKKAINLCRTCNIHKYERKPYNIKIPPRPITEKPFQRVHMDIFAIDNQNFLSLIDSFSKFLQLIPMKTKNLIDVKKAYSKFVSTFRAPEKLVTDHETTFRSIDFQNFTQSLGTQLEFASSSESNGQVERAHSTIIELFNTNKYKFPRCTTKTIINACVSLYNHTIHSTTSYSPNEIIYNETNHPSSQEQMEKIYKNLIENSSSAQEKITKNNNKRETAPIIEEGKEVFIIPNIRSKKQERATGAIAKSVKEKTFKINNNIKRNKNKIKRIKT